MFLLLYCYYNYKLYCRNNNNELGGKHMPDPKPTNNGNPAQQVQTPQIQPVITRSGESTDVKKVQK